MNLDAFESSIFQRAPGAVLAPYEALLAQIMWTAEGVRRAEKLEYPGIFSEVFRGKAPRIAPQMRWRIYSAFVLFGSLDAVSGLHLLDRWLASSGSPYSRREIYGDLVPRAMHRRSPFAHSLEEGHISHPYRPSQEASLQIDEIVARKSISRAARRAVRRAGVETTAQEMDEAVAAGVYPWFGSGIELGRPTVTRALAATLGSISRSLANNLPFVSGDAAGPAWLSDGFAGEKMRTFHVVLDELRWLPRPSSFDEAISMTEDERIGNLRKNIGLLTDALMSGELIDHGDLRAQLREDAKRLEGRSWTGRAARVVTYVSVPLGIAETYAGNAGVGLGLTSLGAAAQALSDLDTRSRRGSWLSMGRDFISPAA
jgi:hypothetical protein